MVAPAVSLDSGPLQNQLTAFQGTVTRDADMEIREDEAADLLRSVAANVRRRRFGYGSAPLQVRARARLWRARQRFPTRS